MVVNRKLTGRAASVPAGLAAGAIVSVVITLLLAVVIGRLVDTEKIQWDNVGYGIMILLITASFFGSAIASARIKRQRMIICLLSGAIYFALLLSITALFFGGQYEAVGVTAALILAGSGTAGLLGLGRKGEGIRKKRRSAYR